MPHEIQYQPKKHPKKHHKPETYPGKKLKSGDARIIRLGHEPLLFRDLYVNLLSAPWVVLILLIALIYLAVNLIFATLYYVNIDGVDNAHTFSDVFFFSVQTMATIGYGRMYPTTPITNTLTTIEALGGFTYFAFITGLMFAKFSRPTAQVLFSKIAVISHFEGTPHLKIRLANIRSNRIVDATARFFLLRYTKTKEGFPMRRFIDLPVVRDHMPLLRLTWTLMHPIDENSPFFGMSQEDLMKSDDEIFVTLVGLDETLSQTIHARYSYLPEDIVFDAYFEDVVKRNADTVELNYEKFHSVVKAAPAEAESKNDASQLYREG